MVLVKGDTWTIEERLALSEQQSANSEQRNNGNYLIQVYVIPALRLRSVLTPAGIHEAGLGPLIFYLRKRNETYTISFLQNQIQRSGAAETWH